MAGDASKGPPHTERIDVERVLSRRDRGVTFLGRDAETGATWVIKEVHRPVREFPPADRRRSVWTRLVLPWGLEREESRTRIIRPFIEGTSLADVPERTALPLATCLTVAIDSLRALDTIHGLGLVHGAVKASNVILDPVTGRAWLVDPSSEEPGGIDGGTSTSEPLARYVSPEVAGASGGPVGPASDLYSLGVVLYGCLTGRPLHAVEDAGGLLRSLLIASPTSVRARGIAVPRVIDEILDRLLRPDPLERYTAAIGVIDDLLETERRLRLGEADPPLVVGLHDVRTSPTQPGLVGRTAELGELDALLTEARQGRGTLIRLEAKSGNGKSRILDEIGNRAAQRGDLVLRAEARELEAPRPFGLLDGLASSLLDVAAVDPAYAERLAQTTGRWGPELRTVLPSLAELLTVAEQEGSGRSVESRVLDALTALFESLGWEGRPAVLLLDDCQWADELSLRVVGRWAAGRPGGYVSVVAALRQDDLTAGHPVSGWPNATTVTLRPFDDAATRDLVTSMVGPIPDEAHAVIRRVSGGRPFVLTSVVRAMVESGALHPGTRGWLVDPRSLATMTASGETGTVVIDRLGRLPEETLSFLSAGAVLGRHATVAEAAGLASIDPDHSDAIVEEARRAGLIWPSEGRDRFSFVHDKVREGALGRLSGTRRRALHLAAAELLERQRPGDLFDLAYHFDQAGAPERALPQALEAAALARARQALESAEMMYRIAFRGIRDGDVTTRARVAEDLGEVLMLRGSYEEAARWLDEARRLVPGGPEAAAIAGKLGELAFKRGDVRTAGEAIQQALVMIDRRVPRNRAAVPHLFAWEVLVQAAHSLLPQVFVGRLSPEEGGIDLLASRFYGRLGYAWWFERGKLSTLWTHLRSLNLAERYPPTPEMAQAYSEHAPAMMLLPWHRRGVRFARRSHEIRVRLGDRWGQGQSLHFWGAGLYAASDFDRSLERMREALELLEATGDQWEVNNCRLQIAMALYRLGDLPGAAEASRAARKAGLEIGDAQARGIGLEGWAKATDGEVPDELIQTELERSSEDLLTLASVRQAEGVQLLASEDARGAIRSFEESQRLFRNAGMKNAGVSPVRPWLLTALRQAAETAPAGELHQLLRRARSIARQAGRRARFYRNDLPHVLRERAHLAALAGRRRRARSLFERSLEVAKTQGARAEALRTRAARGEVGQVLGWTEDVEDGERARRALEALLEAAAHAGEEDQERG
ncbi:MAG: AAA family ATPase [Actinobacteria bacterium]|nr:AAA family ATPase [Actinomycetota bacterium]